MEEISMSHQVNSKAKRKEKQHLSYKERIEIEAYCRAGWNKSKIAREIGVCHTTIGREIKMGQVEQEHVWKENYWIYCADIAQKRHEKRMQGKGKQEKIGNHLDFAQEIERLIKSGYSPFAALQHIRNREIDYGIDICTKTLYNYIDSGLFAEITNKDLLIKKNKKKRKYRKISAKSKHNKEGTSISERPLEIETREEIGHWEIDLVVGKLGTKPAILTLVERKTRKSLYIFIKNKTHLEIINALKKLRKRTKGDFSQVFKTITADNGSEFLDFKGMKKAAKCDEIYYAHPYSSWERGSNENGNRFLRRFIPKGSNLSEITEKQLQEFEDFINNYPRAILDGKSANMLWKCGKVA